MSSLGQGLDGVTAHRLRHGDSHSLRTCGLDTRRGLGRCGAEEHLAPSRLTLDRHPLRLAAGVLHALNDEFAHLQKRWSEDKLGAVQAVVAVQAARQPLEGLAISLWSLATSRCRWVHLTSHRGHVAAHRVDIV